MSSVPIYCGGKRYVVKVTPMQRLQAIIDQVVSQLKPTPELSQCQLLINGKAADLSLQYRFANVTPSSKLELKTGQQSRLGIKTETLQSTQPVSAEQNKLSADAKAAQNAIDSSSGSQESKAIQSAAKTSAAALPSSAHQTGNVAAPAAARSGPLPAQAGPSTAQQMASEGPTSVEQDHPAQSSGGLQAAAQLSGAKIPAATESAEMGQSGDRANGASSQGRSAPEDVPVWCQQLGLDRAVYIFSQADLERAATSSTPEDPPDEFYEFGLEDYARVMQGLQHKKQHAERGLRTAKLREQEEQLMAARFPETTTRIVFPSGDIIQMQFSSTQGVGVITQALAKCLLPDVKASKWYLYTTPPKQVLKDQSLSLYKAGLCPAAKIYFGSETGFTSFLKPELEQARGPTPQTGKSQETPSTLLATVPSGDGGSTEKRPQEKQEGTGKKLPRWMKLNK